MGVKRCRETFIADVDGVPHVVQIGALHDSADPVVRGREVYFEDVAVAAAAAAERARGLSPDSVIESASAEPGERRSLGRGRRRQPEPVIEIPTIEVLTEGDSEV